MNVLSRSACLVAFAVVLSGLAACSALGTQQRDGYVADIITKEVRLCLTSAVRPALGQNVQLVRTARVGDPKAPTLTQHDVGVARISAARGDSCFVATVTEGEARRNDGVRLSHRD